MSQVLTSAEFFLSRYIIVKAFPRRAEHPSVSAWWMHIPSLFGRHCLVPAINKNEYVHNCCFTINFYTSTHPHTDRHTHADHA